jgi:hypothetical protein
MSDTPEANSEYSRGSGAFRALIPARRPRASRAAADPSTERTAGTVAVVVLAALGALLVLVAQFTALYHVRVATSSVPVKTVGTGANHGWAPLPIALVCLALAFAVYRYRNRAALLGLVTLGIATLVIALAADLPDVHATGLVGSSGLQFMRAANSAAAGLYLETLGSVLLIVSGGLGLLMLAPVRLARPAIASRKRATEGRTTQPVAPPARRQEAAPDADGTPPTPKTPLSLRDTERRKWSAS